MAVLEKICPTQDIGVAWNQKRAGYGSSKFLKYLLMLFVTVSWALFFGEVRTALWNLRSLIKANLGTHVGHTTDHFSSVYGTYKNP